MDRLPTILKEGHLYCDAVMHDKNNAGTSIGMPKIKARRLNLPVKCHSTLMVGDCVPFYFCPRSVMLYMFHRNNNSEILYAGGQEPIIHLVADMHETIEWAKSNQLKWAFTDSNAGSSYFESYRDTAEFEKLDWNAINSNDWQSCREKKQAEFLVESKFPWHLIKMIGTFSEQYAKMTNDAITIANASRPDISVKRNWYY